MSRERARVLLSGALVVGVAGDLLLRTHEWRAGFTLWLVLSAALATWLTEGDARERRLLIGGVALASLGLAVRDAEMLMAVDLLSVLCMGALVVWHGSGRRIAELTVVESIRAAVLAPLTLVAGGAGALRPAFGGDEQASARRSSRARAIAIGAVLALPPLFIVTGLLGSSDEVFAAFLEGVGTFLAESGLEHVLAIAFLTWIAAGWMRAAAGEAQEIRVPQVRTPGVAFLTVSVGLYGLVALLTLFIASQLRTLFGGASYLLATAGLTVAEYARSGFFELVVASGVVLGTVVAADWLMAEDDVEGRMRLRTVGSALVLLVAALLVSAVVRMRLYVEYFGLTLDRFVAMAVLVWVLLLLTTLAATTLRGRSARFAPTMLLATAAWVFGLNLVNPEGVVARANVSRAVTAGGFDVPYHATLSADALPVLVSEASRLPAAECEALRTALQAKWRERLVDNDPTDGDWRSADLARMAARRWLAAGGEVSCAR